MAQENRQESGTLPKLSDEAWNKIANAVRQALESQGAGKGGAVSALTLTLDADSRSLLDELSALRDTRDYGRIIHDALVLARAVWKEQVNGYSRVVMQNPYTGSAVELSKRSRAARILEMLP